MSDALATILRAAGKVAIAVSGGVDSLTLATFAHRLGVGDAAMFHAVSPAVPPEATARTSALAEAEGWALTLLDAGEFDDPDYRRNPVDRCFFCKTNLYGAIARRTTRNILSGTNTDDLGEYRPGLDAARAHGVRHPYVEAGIDKAAVRRLAAALGLGAIAALPASPCLASRVETGIAVAAPLLTFIHAAERLVAAALTPRTVRVRVRAAALVVELDPGALAALDAPREAALLAALAPLRAAAGLDQKLRFAPYRNGSAFLRPATTP